jgi:hypothetical protein
MEVNLKSAENLELHSILNLAAAFPGEKNYLRAIGWSGMDWIDLTQDRDPWRAFVNTVMNLRVP